MEIPWSVEEVYQWVVSLGFGNYATAFLENQVDGAALLDLTSQDLKEELRIIPLGHRKAILKAIRRLVESSSSPLSLHTPIPVPQMPVGSALHAARHIDGGSIPSDPEYPQPSHRFSPLPSHPSHTRAMSPVATAQEHMMHLAEGQEEELNSLLREAERLQERMEKESKNLRDRTSGYSAKDQNLAISSPPHVATTKLTEELKPFKPYQNAGASKVPVPPSHPRARESSLRRRESPPLPQLSEGQSAEKTNRSSDNTVVRTAYTVPPVKPFGSKLEELRVSGSPTSKSYNKRLNWPSLLSEQQKELDSNPITKGLVGAPRTSSRPPSAASARALIPDVLSVSSGFPLRPTSAGMPYPPPQYNRIGAGLSILPTLPVIDRPPSTAPRPTNYQALLTKQRNDLSQNQQTKVTATPLWCDPSKA